MDEILLKGRYRQLAEIGRGERTVTYKAQDTSLNRAIVVKVLRERFATEQDSVDRFQNAARAMAGLSHPNIVAIHDIGSDRDLHYVVTEYVEGQNLESLLASQAPLTPEEALDIAIPVCAALDTTHRAGHVHGQLTPRNILLTRDQQVKVSDFGVVDAPLSAREQSPSLYAAHYLSPEQAMGRRAIPASDVYTLGVILYEMLAGRPPFTGDGFSAIAEKHIREEPDPLSQANPQVPGSLSALVHRALAKTSTARYKTASDLEEALNGYRRQRGKIELLERIGPEERPASSGRHQMDREIRAHPRGVAEEKVPSSRAMQRSGLDWVGCIMGAVALVAILGLIPLWLSVFLRYFA
ncbi:MAG: hypothetical protein CEE40_01550 [Chloroflexi bacterium B3_Chlor]|nr:MAG: hypothetical protein CEE40_01550 [Chloroflexi bacterium B3_Chlor]